MPDVWMGHEFEALKTRFEDQTELLHRMALIDLRIFSGFITLQLALGAWIAQAAQGLKAAPRAGLFIVDLGMAAVAAALLYNNYRRRKEVVGTVKNCNLALGYEDAEIYLVGDKLNSATKFRP